MQARIEALEAEVTKERELLRETRTQAEIHLEQSLLKLEREKRQF